MHIKMRIDLDSLVQFERIDCRIKFHETVNAVRRDLFRKMSIVLIAAEAASPSELRE